MKIISFVPSWTETLHACGAELIGRTRFCIHPASISHLPVVGGTKNFNEQLVRELQPDLVILDREENTLEMATALAQITRVHATHVQSVAEMPRELRALGDACAGDVKSRLGQLAERFETVLARKTTQNFFAPEIAESGSSIVYAIWKDPWMAVSSETFIASMLEQAGVAPSRLWPKSSAKYPVFEIENVPRDACVLLSSEPYPFHKKMPDLSGRCHVLVDGESFSWFGIRALAFLEGLKR